MVLRLSELVKKSIDKGYGSSPHSIEKPWTQGNLSSIDLKTGKNPFIKNTSVKCLQITPLPSNDSEHEDTPLFNTVSASVNAQNSRHAVNINQTTVSKPTSDKHWWENINFSEATQSTASMRLLVNYNLLCEDL